MMDENLTKLGRNFAEMCIQEFFEKKWQRFSL